MTALLLAALLSATAPLTPPPAQAPGASGSSDPAAATRAWIDTLPAAQRAKSDAYFEGGYWLDLWEFLWSAAILLLLLFTGASAKMRDRAERATNYRALQTALYWLQFVAVTFVLSFPLSIYRGWFREHQYGLSNLTLGGWLGEEAKGLMVSAVFGT